MKFVILFIFFLITSCATTKVEKIQEDNCFSYKNFPDYHRCSERVVKNSYTYKLSFEKNIIDEYFAYGEVLAIDVEKGRKNNFEAFMVWGKELEKSIEQAKLKGKKTAKTVIITAVIAIAVYVIYKEYLEKQMEIKEISEAKKTTTSSISSLSFYTQNQCNYGKYLYSVTRRLNPLLTQCR